MIEVPSEVVEGWRAEALAQLERPEMELGWRDDGSAATSTSYEAFRAELAAAIAGAEIRCCRLTVHAIGTVVLWLELDTLFATFACRSDPVAFAYHGRVHWNAAYAVVADARPPAAMSGPVHPTATRPEGPEVVGSGSVRSVTRPRLTAPGR